MEDTQDNYFGLAQPELWFCKIRHYGMGHSNMEIGIYNSKTEENKYCHFVGVEYFEGSLAWQGANFRIGSSKSCLEIMRRTTDSDRQNDEDILSVAKLFIAEIVNTNVSDLGISIIATGAVISGKSVFSI